jgi:site-specific DNA-methyltransferase (adenine-specific)
MLRSKIECGDRLEVERDGHLTAVETISADVDGFFRGHGDAEKETVLSHSSRIRIWPRVCGGTEDRTQLVHGDSLQKILDMPTGVAQLTVTSPPYFRQRNYTGLPQEIGRETEFETYNQTLVEFFGQCLRVTKDDGCVVFNLGDKYVDGSLQLIPWRFAMDVLDRYKDVKLVNVLTWEKSAPCPRQNRRQLTNSTEPFFIFAKSKRYYFNLESLNDREPKKVSNPHNVGMRYFREIERSKLTPAQKHHARAELQRTRDQVIAGNLYNLRMKIDGIHKPSFGNQPGGRKMQMDKNGFAVIPLRGRQMHKDIFKCALGARNVRHPAMFPIAIIERLVKLLTKEGDIVFDPFMGSGSTALACKNLDRRCIGCDLSLEYLREAVRRIWFTES